MRYQEIVPLLGPYEARGRKGERYVIDDLRELYWQDTLFFYRCLQLSGAVADGSRALGYGLSFDLADEVLEQKRGSGVAASMWEDVYHAYQQELAAGSEQPGIEVLGYFTLTHLTASKCLEGVSEWTVQRVISALGRGDPERARAVWQHGKRQAAEPQRHSGKKRGHGNTLRHMATTAERRRNAADVAEHGEAMVRGARRRLPDVWWDIWRERDHSWKQKKIRKQWMKHLPR